VLFPDPLGPTMSKNTPNIKHGKNKKIKKERKKVKPGETAEG
jgi:hypothetical protein